MPGASLWPAILSRWSTMALGTGYLCWKAVMATLALTIVCSGLGVWYHFSQAALNSSQSALFALGVDLAKVPLDSARTMVRATLSIYVILAAALSALGLYRVVALAKQSTSPACSSGGGWYLAAAMVLLVLAWLAEVWLLLLHMIYPAWFMIALSLDKGSSEALSSDAPAKWQTVREVYSGVQDLITSLPELANNMALTADAKLAPTISSLDAAVSTKTCPASCVDISSWDFMDPSNATNLCLCDMGRFVNAQPYASNAWKNELCWALLGMGLAFLGFTWQAVSLAADVARAMCEKNHVAIHMQALQHFMSLHTNATQPIVTAEVCVAQQPGEALPGSGPPQPTKVTGGKEDATGGPLLATCLGSLEPAIGPKCSSWGSNAAAEATRTTSTAKPTLTGSNDRPSSSSCYGVPSGGIQHWGYYEAAMKALGNDSVQGRP